MNLYNRGPQGSAVKWGGGCGERTLRRSVRVSPAAAIGVAKAPTLHVQAGSREALPRKNNTTVLWPREGHRGLRRHCCSTFRRRLQIAYRTYWVRELLQPRSSLRPGPTGSIGQDHKTRNELKEGRTQGGELRVRGRRRHRTQNSAGRGRGEHTAQRSGRSPSTPT